jgi:hypothetical protein
MTTTTGALRERRGQLFLHSLLAYNPVIVCNNTGFVLVVFFCRLIAHGPRHLFLSFVALFFPFFLGFQLAGALCLGRGILDDLPTCIAA